MKPLQGIRVLDLSRLVPGPYASLVLADLGATVDKVEDPSGGDYLRHMPPMTGRTGEISSMFLAFNRNKRSASIDLKKPAAQRALLRMVGRYDVLFDQFRPGVLDRLGLPHAALRAANPRLIICALTGYGQDGPLAQRAGHDINYLARAGVLGMHGPADAPPQVPGFQLADIGGALWSVVGILAALLERSRTGEGSVVDIAMVEAAMGFALTGYGGLFGGKVGKRGDDELTGGLAMYNTYRAKDGGFVSFGALEPKFWTAFCGGVALEVDTSAFFAGPHQRQLKDKLTGIFATRTRDEWEAFGKQHDCCVEPVLGPEEALSDPHLAARGMFFTIDSPWGPLQQLRTPVTPLDMAHTPPPRQGEHTEAILREGGLSDDDIAELQGTQALG
jgi:crotonobetainyl-CoA:carnitine CoA-transferase CaiB-like acyl-CoA transferase